MPNRKRRTGWRRLPSGGVYYGTLRPGEIGLSNDDVQAHIDAIEAAAELVPDDDPPAKSAPKADWLVYALQLAPDPDTVEVIKEMTKAELVEFVDTMFSGSPAAHDDESGPDDPSEESA